MMFKYLKSFLIVILTVTGLCSQPTIDGVFDGEAIWGTPVAMADGNQGWANANIENLYVTYNSTYVFIGISILNAADWQSFGIAMNTDDSIGSTNEVWNYPITYGHGNSPNFVIKGHFGQGGSPYAELRKWMNPNWLRLDNDGSDNGLATSDFSAEEGGFLEFRIKLSILNNPLEGDLQVYITGNNQSEHATFDACPNDENANNWIDATILDNYVHDIAFSPTPIVIVSPILPTDNDVITVSLDASTTNLSGESEVYFHAGVSTDLSNPYSFSNVVGNWGQDDGIGEMTNIGTDLWEFTIPNARSYFMVDSLEDIFGLNFLFRNGAGDMVEDSSGSNYHNAMDPEDYFIIVNPVNDPLFELTGTNVPVEFEGIIAPTSWSLDKVDSLGNVISNIATAGAVTTFSHSIVEAVAGNYRFKTTANFVSGTKVKYFEIEYYNPVQEMARPSWVEPGINYHPNDSTKAILVLHAPTFTQYFKHPNGIPQLSGTNNTTPKNIVHVIGDFNNWSISENYKMYRDSDGWDENTQTDQDGDNDHGDYWWIELDNLVVGQPYVFQYLIDGVIQVADPYTNHVVDQDDQYISNERNSEIIPYPSQAQGRASLLRTNSAIYNWTAPSFTKPGINKLNIYEMHFRDFTEEGTYLAAADRLDYLSALGINAIHVMPVSEFEGNSSWGYNPNFYFASDKYYGTPNDLKYFIDECHKREIQVFNDMVLNHSFYSNVMARMYWNNIDNKPSNDNPWFNPDHKMIYDPAGWWGADWNHESEHTQKMVDRILNYWIEEFKFDGFRFDFTKGFGQSEQDVNDPWASSYDQDRIDLLLRMVNEMQTNNPSSVAIFEHLANNSEEAVLADDGILMWSGAGHHNHMKEFMLGWNGQDIYNSGIFSAKGFTYANLMSYMESHDEERQAYEIATHGNGNANYTTMDIVDRLKIGSSFNLLFPGPRMIWQFEELAYDISIDFNGRTGEKPVHWDYYFNQDRQELWRLISIIFHIRNTVNLYATIPDYGNIGSSDGVSVPRRMQMHDGNGQYVISIANLDTENSRTVSPNYGTIGTWYKYNGDKTIDGTTYNVNTVSDTYVLGPSESLILTNFDIGWTDDCADPEACCVKTVFSWIGGVGNWNDSSNWDKNAIPKPCDIVIIPSNGQVTIPAGIMGYANDLIIMTGGTLNIMGELVTKNQD